MRVRPRSTQHKPGIRRTPRRHPATRNDGLPQSSTRTRQTRNRTPGELPAGIPTPRNDGPPPKLDADTTQCTARRQQTPRQHTGLAEQRDSPRRSRRTHTTFHTNFIPDQRGGKARRAHDVSTLDQFVPPSTAATRAPRLHARLRAAPHRPADSPPARRYAHLTSFLQHKKSTHLRNPTHVSSSESTRTVGDGTALSSNCTFLAHMVHTNMKGFPPY